MKTLDPKFFKKFPFTSEQIEKYWKNALKDFYIAKRDSIPEVKFLYSYQTLIKISIAVVAKVAGMKVRSISGHHAHLLEALSLFLENPRIVVIGDVMRSKRNTDLYGGGADVTEKEAEDFFKFVGDILKQAEEKT